MLLTQTEKTVVNTDDVLDSEPQNYELEEEDEEKTEEEEEEEEEGGPPGALVKVFKFIMKQSYICALIAMMVRRSKVIISRHSKQFDE